MKINCDNPFSLKEAIYDERNLVYSESGRNKYPSKKMFVEFLKQYKDIPANVEIWSMGDLINGTTTINVKLEYKVKTYKREPKKKCLSKCDELVCCKTDPNHKGWHRKGRTYW